MLRIQKWFRVPKVLAKMLDATIGRIISSSPPQEGILPMGATLEIQRLQQLEVLEQQMLLNRSREARYYGQVKGTMILTMFIDLAFLTT